VFGPILARFVQAPAQALLGDVPILGSLVSGAPVGIGILSAGIILAIMVIPFIASVMRDVFETTPPMLKESAYALGSTTWEVVWKVVLPYTKSGVIGAIMLGLGRAMGETIAVALVIAQARQMKRRLWVLCPDPAQAPWPRCPPGRAPTPQEPAA
jgi:phosphate transport system permease protein